MSKPIDKAKTTTQCHNWKHDLDLEPNTRYVVTIQNVLPPVAEGDARDVLEALTGTLEAPQDWASEHDHYLYGTPKRQHETTA